MEGKTDLCCVSLRAASGLNLQRATCVVFGELDWSPAVHSQAEDRAHRIGQRQPVTIYRLVTTDTVVEGFVAAHNGEVGVLAAPYDPDTRSVEFPAPLPAEYLDDSKTPQLFLRVWEEHLTGNTLGALGVISTLILATTAAAALCLGVIGNDWINGEEALKLLLAYVASIVYMGTFYCLGAIVTARSKVAINGLLVALGIWLVIVLVLPPCDATCDAVASLALRVSQPHHSICSYAAAYWRSRSIISVASLM